MDSCVDLGISEHHLAPSFNSVPSLDVDDHKVPLRALKSEVAEGGCHSVGMVSSCCWGVVDLAGVGAPLDEASRYKGFREAVLTIKNKKEGLNELETAPRVHCQDSWVLSPPPCEFLSHQVGAEVIDDGILLCELQPLLFVCSRPNIVALDHVESLQSVEVTRQAHVPIRKGQR